MKWLVTGVLIAGLAFSGVLACGKIVRSQGPPLEINITPYDGVDRIYGIYAPQSLISDSAPLVFLLHGGGGAAQQIFETEYGQSWRQLADENGFLLVLPEGRADLSSNEDHHWNDCRTGINNPNVNTQLDDVGFITSLIDLMDARFGINENRVYSTGASNGGMMSFRLAYEATSRFAAIAAIIANLPDPSECTLPTAPISVLIMNGTEDPLVPYEGGCVANANCQRGMVTSTDNSIMFWNEHNGTSSEAVVENFPDVNSQDGSSVTSYSYLHGLNDTKVVLYRVDGGGHTVPGEEPLGIAARSIVGPKNLDINGARETWEFFSSLSR